MKIIIEQDMEGCAQILDWSGDLKKAGKLAWASRIMTEEVNAAIDGAFAAGATEVSVLEAHDYDYDVLDSRVAVLREPLTSINIKADALFFVGRHAMYGVQDGVLTHTGSSHSFTHVMINGRAFGELGLVAAWFGGQGIPVAMVAGDHAACREANDFLGSVVTVPVKQGIACHQAVCMSPKEANRLIRQGAQTAVKRIGEFKPFAVEGKAKLEIHYPHPEIVDWVSRIPGLTRSGPCTTLYEAPDFASALRMYYAQGAMLWRYDA